MTKEVKEEKPPARMGHPPLEIDWHKVDMYLEADCNGTEVAASMGICVDTLYRRCEKEKGMTFAVYKQQKRAKGDLAIKLTQHKLALEKDRGMLIWLGKNRLDQKDAPTNDKSPNDSKLDQLTAEIKAHGVKV